MGSYRKGILGPFRGKVGSVIGYSWRGEDLMRGLPKESTVAPTSAQEAQRVKFSTVMKFLFPIKSVLSMYFGKEQKTKSEFNLASSYHLKEAVLPGPDDSWLIDYPKVLISRGDLRGMDDPVLSPGSPAVINLDWTDNSGQGSADATDILVAIGYAEDLNEFVLFDTIAVRADGSAALNFPGYFSGSQAQIWATFAKAGKKLAAISSYAGVATVP